MPTGLDYVQATIALCQRLTSTLGSRRGIDQPAVDYVVARLAQVEATLTGMQDRFFLRSKLCLPFAVRCEQEAIKLEQALGAWSTGEPIPPAVQDVLKSMEQAVKLLDDRSGAQGMVIT